MTYPYYIARRAEPEILGSGTSYSLEVTTRTEDDAFRFLAECGWNELVQVNRVDGQLHCTHWDTDIKNWVD